MNSKEAIALFEPLIGKLVKFVTPSVSMSYWPGRDRFHKVIAVRSLSRSETQEKERYINKEIIIIEVPCVYCREKTCDCVSLPQGIIVVVNDVVDVETGDVWNITHTSGRVQIEVQNCTNGES